MVPARQAVPNTSLRQQRLQRSWTLDRVAAELDRLCAREGHHAGVTGNMVGKWERGLKRPSLFYREKLCALCGATAESLGFLDDQPAPPARTAAGHLEAGGAEPFPGMVTPIPDTVPPPLVARRNPAVEAARRSVLRGTAQLPGDAAAPGDGHRQLPAPEPDGPRQRAARRRDRAPAAGHQPAARTPPDRPPPPAHRRRG